MNPTGTRLIVVCASLILTTLKFTVHSDAQDIRDSMVGAWLLDEGRGNEAKDSSDSENHGSLVALTNAKPKWVKGKFGRALEFDGNSTVVDCGNSESLNAEGPPITITAWIKPNWNLASPRLIFCGNNGYCFPVGDEPRALDFGKGGVDHVGSQDLLDADNNWHHVAVVYDKRAGVSFYLDGKVDKGSPHEYATAFQESKVTYYIGGTDRFNKWLGIIDEVAVFKAVLSADEIRSVMKGLSGALAVSPSGKKALIWGNIKSGYIR